MPRSNKFHHQQYPTTLSTPPEFVQVEIGDGAEAAHDELHTQHRIRNLVLVHGTFMGSDGFAVADILESIGNEMGVLKGPLTGAAEKLRAHVKPLTDKVAADIGNFTPEFCGQFQKLVGTDPHIERLSPTWSSQNHHYARADLAARLFHRLTQLQPQPDARTLLWGHSHAGNGFALLTNLLGSDRETRRQFLAACGHTPKTDKQPEHWITVVESLWDLEGPVTWASAVDIVGFGTPVRYGWETQGCGQLIHVLHHRNFEADTPHLTKPLFPPHLPHDVIHAKWGDWVQALGIAGTDVPPPTLLKRDRAVAGIVEQGLVKPGGLKIVPEKIRATCVRWATGTRCHADGRNLLLTYQASGERSRLGVPLEESMFGHGVATSEPWLPTHLALVNRALRGRLGD